MKKLAALPWTLMGAYFHPFWQGFAIRQCVKTHAGDPYVVRGDLYDETIISSSSSVVIGTIEQSSLSSNSILQGTIRADIAAVSTHSQSNGDRTVVTCPTVQVSTLFHWALDQRQTCGFHLKSFDQTSLARSSCSSSFGGRIPLGTPRYATLLSQASCNSL